jgi:chloramphenicol 3-O phosphotransferase
MLLQLIKNNKTILACSAIIMLTFTCCVFNTTESCGTVIILNGTSAVGKSSIMRAFQDKHTEPWLGMGIDNFFINLLPFKFYFDPQYGVMRGDATEDEQGKLFTLHIGPEGQKMIRGMHRAIAAYAKAGNNVIVDYIMYDAAWHDDLMSALSGVQVVTVGVTASLPVVQQREKARATSPEGHARSIYHTVHQGWKYDLEINTDELTPEQIADVIDQQVQKVVNRK